MRQKLFAVIIIIIVVSFVIINTIVIESQIDDIQKRVENLIIHKENATEEAVDIYNEFKKKEIYISLTVNHDDLTNIEDYFVELVGCLSIGNVDDASVTKDRLTSSLEHLRRLSTFTIDAII